MPVAYLSPSLLQDLTNVSVSPGAGNTGYPLVWNNATGRFELAVLGVAGGGTGTSNGSITGTGAITLAAGGTNQNITLSPSGSGNVTVASTTQSTSTTTGALIVNGGVGIAKNLTLQGSLVHRSTSTIGYLFQSLGPSGGNNALGIALHSGPTSSTDFLWMSNNGTSGGWGGPDNYVVFASATNDLSSPAKSIWISAHNDLLYPVPGILVQANTNRVGIAKSNPAYTLDVGGSLRASGVAINFANLPTSNTGLAVGDLWRDGEIVKVKL